MPTNHTPHYNLSQWERNDRILMEDFNEDNAKIDAALAAQAGTLAAHATELTRKGNCQIWTTTYQGTGTRGASAPTVIHFPENPLLIVVVDTNGDFALLIPGTERLDRIVSSKHCYTYLTWAKDSLSAYSPEYAQFQFNGANRTYVIVTVYQADKT
jgi:hypothetical protein